MKKAKIAELERKFLEQKVETLDISSEIVCLFEETDPVMTRELVNLLLKKGAKMAAVFSGNEREGYRYVLGSRRCQGKWKASQRSVSWTRGRKAGDGAGNCTREKRRD